MYVKQLDQRVVPPDHVFPSGVDRSHSPLTKNASQTMFERLREVNTDHAVHFIEKTIAILFAEDQDGHKTAHPAYIQ